MAYQRTPTKIAIVGGADIVRVHDVKVISRISRMSDAIVRSKKS